MRKYEARRSEKRKSKQVAEFGDFQTPVNLAIQVCQLLSRKGIHPNSLIEPTCGIGNFLFTALAQFPSVKQGIGLDINPNYVNSVLSTLRERCYASKIKIVQNSFFHVDWETILKDLPEPLLVIGNPPWVTNAELGSLGSSNLPKKTNFQNHHGLDAVTGKSNFDISEWMLIKMLEWLNRRRATMAMLCKTAVARKVLQYAWENNISLEKAEIYLIDATTFFGAAVDACLLVCSLAPLSHNHDCMIFNHLSEEQPAHVFGLRDGRLVADVVVYERWKHLEGKELYEWHSGIKHDCTKVMELSREGSRYQSSLGELLDLEDDYLYPMLKSSEVAKGSIDKPTRWMLVTQRSIGEDTEPIKLKAPKTWQYLVSHADLLDRRASSIYQNRPRFSVFGVGDYSFAPWKVAISGFYKKLQFTVIPSFLGKPIVLDDTVYFIACQSEEEACYLASLLNSAVACEFFSAFIFWDAKRPITIEILRRLDLLSLARELGTENIMIHYLSQNSKSQTPYDSATSSI